LIQIGQSNTLHEDLHVSMRILSDSLNIC